MLVTDRSSARSAPAVFVCRRDLLAAVRRASAAIDGRSRRDGRRAASSSDRAGRRRRRSCSSARVCCCAASGGFSRSTSGFTRGRCGHDGKRLVEPEVSGSPDAVAAFQRDLLARVRALPGCGPRGPDHRRADARRRLRDGPSARSGGSEPRPGNMRTVDPEYFRIMQPAPARRTHVLREQRHRDQRAGHWWCRESYGRLLLRRGESARAVSWTCDGATSALSASSRDVRYADVTRDPYPAFYLPSWPESDRVDLPRRRTAAGSAGKRSSKASGTPCEALDPDQPVEGITTIGQIVSQSTADRRFYAVTTGAFAAVALLLAIAGIFGVVSRTVSERRQELAIRVALGAEPRRLLRLVYGYGLVPGRMPGHVAGSGGGLHRVTAAAEVSSSRSPRPTPPPTPAQPSRCSRSPPLACYLPARRTLRVQPMAVLKSD